MSTAPTEALSRLFIEHERQYGQLPQHTAVLLFAIAQLLADSEARAVEATIKRIEQEELEPALAALTAERERVRVLREALEFWRDIKSESAGLAGYHLNGDICGWGELDDPTEAALAASADHAKEGSK